MIIRKYGQVEASYLPDPGEVVLARRSSADRYVKAVIIKVRRLRDGQIKYTVQWLENDPRAGTYGGPIIKGEIGWVRVHPDGWPSLIQQISKDQPGS